MTILTMRPFVRHSSRVRSTMYLTISKFSSGSPPWNSSFNTVEGLLNMNSIPRSATACVMSNPSAVELLRDTWQYEQELLHRSVGTNMCSPVNSERGCCFVLYLVASKFSATECAESVKKCRDLSRAYNSESCARSFFCLL